MLENALKEIHKKTTHKSGQALLSQYCDSLNYFSGSTITFIAETDSVFSFLNLIFSSSSSSLSGEDQNTIIKDFFQQQDLKELFKKPKFIEPEKFKRLFGERHIDGNYLNYLYGQPLYDSNDECRYALVSLGNYEQKSNIQNTLFQTFSNHIVSELEHINKQDQYYNQQFFDPLTKLPNRFSLSQKLNDIKPNNICNSILFIDIDYFKTINDSLGHFVGDTLLKQFAEIIDNFTGDYCELFRMGSDEFALLILDGGEDYNSVALEAEQLAQQIIQQFTTPVSIDFHELIIGLSIGICPFYHYESTENIIRHGDISLNQAKNSGRNTFRVYTSDMQENSQQKIFLKNDLVKAIHNNELEIFLQPQVDNHNNLYGAETLIRWQNNGQYISPMDFIPLAEETGLIKHIGNIVLDKSCAFLHENRQLLSQSFRKLSINVSPIEFYQPYFVENFIAIFEKYNLPPNAIEIELTENVFFKERYESIKKMYKLLEYGFTFAIDDFGTGYSSLSYLVELPFNKLKIDKSFIQKIHESPRFQKLVESIINICNHMELDVIAEGVENVDDFHFLKEHNCKYYQGFYFAKPMSIENFKKLYVN